MTEQWQGMHEGDMAEELAEWEFHNAPMREVLDKYVEVEEYERPLDAQLRMARLRCRREWLQLAEREPEKVRRLYDNFRGVPTT